MRRAITRWVGMLITTGLLFFILIIFFPFVSLAAEHNAADPAQRMSIVQDAPTMADLITSVNNWSWIDISAFASTMALIIAGIFAVVRWFNDRRIERDKRSEERFLVVVEGLGGERTETKVGAAIMLRTFLGSDYKQFYSQTFDLAVAHLRLRKAALGTEDDADAPIPLTPLAQALITVFGEAFPRARDFVRRNPRSLNAAEIQLDRAYLSEADLRTIWMPRAYLREAIMNRVNLSDALLSDAIFTNAELRGANLAKAQLRRANFSHSNLSGANLSGTKLRRAIFVGANLSGVDFSGAELPQANLAETNIEQAKSLLNAKLYKVTGLTVEQINACIAKGAILEEEGSVVNQPATNSEI